MKGNLRECADALAELVWGRLDYWFMYISNSLKFYIKIIGSFPRYHSVYHHKNTPSSRFMYNCAQGKARQHKPKKGKTEDIKERDKDRMDTFDCHGWIDSYYLK